MNENQKHNFAMDLRKQRFLERYSFLITISTYVFLMTLLVLAIVFSMKDVVYLIVGFVIGNGLKDATNFWFGSSPVSREKDRAIATLTDTQKEDTLNVTVKGMSSETNDAILALQKDPNTELAELEAIEKRTEEQENRLQQLKNLKNV